MARVLFTSETASEMGKRGQAAMRRTLANPKQLESSPTADTHQARRLARVRKQLELVDKRLTEELTKDGSIDPATQKPRICDGQLVNWLASAQFRLSDQEFALANRPKPAMAKVTPQGRTRRELPPPMPIQEPEASKPTPGDVPPQSTTPGQPAVPGASGA